MSQRTYERILVALSALGLILIVVAVTGLIILGIK